MYFGSRLLAIVPPPTVSVLDAAVFEGNAGTATMVFTVVLSTPLAKTVSVNYSTANGTASAPADYVAKSGTLTFSSATTSQTVNVTVNGDIVKEGAETFALNLGTPSGVAIARSPATGTIIDDEKELYFTVTPCRILDTRTSGGALAGGSSRTIAAAGLCGVPTTATAVAFNITAVTPSAGGDLRVFPASGATPLITTLNFNAGVTRSNNGIVKLVNQQITVLCGMAGGQSTHFLIDVSGYFQ